MFLAAISGSSPATAASVGLVMINSMVKLGYDKNFAMGLVCASGTLGILIPPSIPMILYGSITSTPVGSLFMAGFIPGIVAGFLLIATVVSIAKWKGYGKHEPSDWNTRWNALIKAAPVMVMPIIILGGIYGGIFTPTEAASVACIYAFLVAALVYRSLGFKELIGALSDSMRVSAMIFVIVMAAILFGRLLTFTQLPQEVSSLVTRFGLTAISFLVMANILYILLGSIVETVTIIYVTVPLFFPSLIDLGINPIHFGIILTMNMEIALVTPPIGMNLYIVSGIAKEGVGSVIRGVVPFVIVLILTLFLVTYVPWLSLFLPKVLGY
jgi:C4-dicarboxylate transporter DctM subunit